MTSRTVRSLVLAATCALVLVGCELNTSATLKAGPSFLLGGSGRLVSFSVWGPRPGRKIATPYDSRGLMWRIEPESSDRPSGVLVSLLDDITYGRAPRGYLQEFPSRGPALPLDIGKVYDFYAETTGASGTGGFFYMAPNGPILINVPGLCLNSLVLDVEPVRCGTHEPYVEPADLAKFVQENRVK